MAGRGWLWLAMAARKHRSKTVLSFGLKMYGQPRVGVFIPATIWVASGTPAQAENALETGSFREECFHARPITRNCTFCTEIRSASVKHITNMISPYMSRPQDMTPYKALV